MTKVEEGGGHKTYCQKLKQVIKKETSLGGKQPMMRPGWYTKGGVRIKQYMVYQGGVHAGKPKGLKAVCEERFGVDAVQGN